MNKKTKSNAGSYTFGQFEKNAEELERLKMQATVALSLEREIWRSSGLKAGMKVLDLACGPGFISCELAKQVGSGLVTGVDISEELIAVAQQVRSIEKVQNVSFAIADVYDLNLAEDAFDFVYARFVFQHLKKPRLALKNILRVLKPGGILCVVDIDDNWSGFAPEGESFMKFIRKSGAGQKRKGGNRWIGSQLYGLLCGAGLKNVSTKIYPLTTEDLGVRMFLGVAVLFRLEMLNKPQKLFSLPRLRKIKTASQDEHAWGAIGIFTSVGRKARD